MKVVLINTVLYGSTGNIVKNIASSDKNVDFYIAIPFGRYIKKLDNSFNYIKIGSALSQNLHLCLGFLTGYTDCFSKHATKKFLNELDKIKPDIIHIHNLHNCYINITMLFNYIKKNNIKVVWTFHDCWPFTGHCPNFDFINCQKWKTACTSCPSYKKYPKTLFDNSNKMYKIKKATFTRVKNLTIITPSMWLSSLVKESFLKDYDIRVINNGIDLNIFKPTISNFRKKFGLEDKIILLGVAYGWGTRKGLEDFIKLNEKLPKNYQIVLVGTTSEVDLHLPKNIISIHKTDSVKDLVEIYSAADLFVNPTLEENFPTVNIESIACGTPIITYNTGGSAEIIDDSCGLVIEKGDFEQLLNKIIEITTNDLFKRENCVVRSKLFDKNIKFREYIDLYSELYNKEKDVN